MTQIITGSGTSLALFVLAAVSLLVGLAAAAATREGWAFTGTFTAIGAAVAGMFAALFPEVMPSSLRPLWALTTTNAAATDYTLTVMTWVALVFTPIVLGYQSWTYWVFRRRISTRHIPAATPATPAGSTGTPGG